MGPWEKKVSAAAASASINKTLHDIDEILKGVNLPQAAKKREELRDRIREALTETAISWFKDGFRGGHVIATRAMLESNQIPRSISKTATRQLPNGQEPSKVIVKSELPMDLIALVKLAQEQSKGFSGSTGVTAKENADSPSVKT